MLAENNRSLKTVTEMEKIARRFKNPEKPNLNFSNEFIKLLDNIRIDLETTNKKIQHVLSQIRLLDNTGFISLTNIVTDLKNSGKFYENFSERITSLLDYINSENNNLMSNSILAFYTLLNNYNGKDVHANFFDMLKSSINRSNELCTKLIEMHQATNNLTSLTININLFHQSKSLIKNILFNSYYQLRKESTKKGVADRNIKKKNELDKPDKKEKIFLIEVIEIIVKFCVFCLLKSLKI